VLRLPAWACVKAQRNWAATDFATAGQNPLAVSRHYNSEDGVFGNWRWTYNRGVFISPTEVDVIRADGKVIYFIPSGSGG
jgi:hypothetical protein